MKYLIVGLGNIGEDYAGTRHNIGFDILDALAKASSSFFSPDRLGDIASFKAKGKTFILLKPSTYMNLSGKAVNYWLQKEKIDLSRCLIVTDDLSLPFGTLRMRGKGSDGGHNGLKNINEILGTSNYARLRFGIGAEFSQGRQVDYVLSPWGDDEKLKLPERLEKSGEMITSFGLIGLERTMNFFNGQ